MDKAIIIYENGDRYINDGLLSLQPHGLKVVQQISLKHASWSELQELRRNPNNQTLIDTITKRQ